MSIEPSPSPEPQMILRDLLQLVNLGATDQLWPFITHDAEFQLADRSTMRGARAIIDWCARLPGAPRNWTMSIHDIEPASDEVKITARTEPGDGLGPQRIELVISFLDAQVNRILVSSTALTIHVL